MPIAYTSYTSYILMTREVTSVKTWMQTTNLSWICLLLSLLQRQRNVKKRCQVRSCWVRPWICSRPRIGGYNEALLKDLRVSDCKAHQNFCRMSNDDYQQILTLISPLITYQDACYRQAISADERSTCRQKLNMFNFFRQGGKSFDMLPKTATCRTATFDMSKQRSTCCFDLWNSTVASTCCWCGRGFNDNWRVCEYEFQLH